ncbi:MAG: iron ABC transporter permease [Acholeplasmatales bacterium]|nr:iron ABC transporter permease [Acholeplasmatales bacterium]
MKNRLNNIKKSKSYYIALIVILIAILLISFMVSISLGAVKIDFETTYKVVFGKLFHQSSLLDGISKAKISIIWNIRVPRVILGLVAGAGLALCGCVMQATVNNPISEPYILGVSAGATFGATLIIMVGLKIAMSLGAFIGAIIATFLVIFIASRKTKMTTVRLILAGTVVNALFTAFSNFIISVAGNSDSIMTLKFWTMGSLANATWDSIWLPLALVLCACIFFLTQGRILNTMMIGDDVATTLGINLSIYRLVYLVIIAILTGVLVSNCGVIGFVGLVIPHLSRAIVGSNHKRLIPIVIILGSLFLIWADVLARVLIENSELPIGIFTALVGAPFFIYIVARRNYGRD